MPVGSSVSLHHILYLPRLAVLVKICANFLRANNNQTTGFFLSSLLMSICHYSLQGALSRGFSCL